MLLLAVSVAGYSGYSFLSKFKTSVEDVTIHISQDGVDVEIRKFRVIHESSGRKEWELKADVAQINQSKGTTKMSNVEYVFINKDNKKFQVFADSGILYNKTNDMHLEGHVKMIIESAILEDRFKNKPAVKPQPKP